MTKISLNIILLILAVLLSCKTTQPSHELKLSEYLIPPGTVKIADNSYIDETEISNFSYLEFIWWTSRVYGKTEMQSILPDTLCWMRLPEVKCPICRVDYYLRHPAYRDHPLVGVSYEQALKFSKWRSDRVMEFILISRGLIPHIPNPQNDSIFSIEAYFTGKYFIKPNPYIQYYPEYSLPDSMTYMKSLKFADSLNQITIQHRGNKGCDSRHSLLKVKEITEIRCLETIPERNDTLPYGVEPTKIVYCKNCKRSLMTDLLGNVREMTKVKGVTFGGSYYDSCKVVNTKYFYRIAHEPGTYTDHLHKTTYFNDENREANSYTGFRNVCTWKKWSE